MHTSIIAHKSDVNIEFIDIFKALLNAMACIAD